MNPSASKGNNPELWDKLLATLDDKLQLGLLDHLTRVKAYHFEEDILYIEPGSEADQEYLSRDSTFQQLQVFAQSSLRVDRVKIKKLSNDS